jgi:hypothetical protein
MYGSKQEGFEGGVVRGRGGSWKGWFVETVRKYFVRNEKFRSEISRFREGLRVLKLEGLNLKMKLKCFKGVCRAYEFQRVEWYSTGLPRVRDRRFGRGLL